MPRKPKPPPSPPSGEPNIIYVGDNIQAKLDAAAAGSTMTFQAGIHRTSTHLLPKSGMRLVGDGVVYIDGYGGGGGIKGSSTAINVELNNLTFRNFVNSYSTWPRAAVHCGPGWILDKVAAHQCSEVGIEIHNGVRIRNGSSATYNKRYGIVGGPATDIIIEDSLIQGNNTGLFDWGHDAGGTKFIRCNTLILRRNTVLSNLGNGLWTDWDNRFVTFDANDIRSNKGMGIFHEVSQEATISNNNVVGNGEYLLGKSIWWGAQIYLFDSEHVDVTGNVVDGGINAIGIRDQDRGQTAYGASETTDILIHSNDIWLRQTEARVGMVTDRSPWAQVTWTENRYRVGGAAAATAWVWQGANRNWAAWQGYGHDAAGTVAPL